MNSFIQHKIRSNSFFPAFSSIYHSPNLEKKNWVSLLCQALVSWSWTRRTHDGFSSSSCLQSGVKKDSGLMDGDLDRKSWMPLSSDRGIPWGHSLQKWLLSWDQQEEWVKRQLESNTAQDTTGSNEDFLSSHPEKPGVTGWTFTVHVTFRALWG